MVNFKIFENERKVVNVNGCNSQAEKKYQVRQELPDNKIFIKFVE